MDWSTFEAFDEAMYMIHELCRFFVDPLDWESEDLNGPRSAVADEALGMLAAWDEFKANLPVMDKPKIVEPSETLVEMMKSAKACGHITEGGAAVFDVDVPKG